MLDDWHIRILIQSQALMLEVEGMKAENEHRKDQGLAQAYGEEHFQGVRMEMDDLANQLRN